MLADILLVVYILIARFTNYAVKKTSIFGDMFVYA